MRDSFIWTYTSQKFYPLDPHEEEVKIEDIAHALSQMCRANGHFKHFYSVAQHSINCANEAKARGLDKRMQLACLLHDASEAYIADLNRPVKNNLKEYVTIEARLQAVIFSAFQLTGFLDDEWAIVNEIDDALLCYEFDHLHDQALEMESQILSSTPDLGEKTISSVDVEFIRKFHQIFYDRHFYKSVGIDGCKGGWAVFWVDTEGGFDFEICQTIKEIFSKHDNANSVLIDIPIGLAESINDIRPDGELRRRLKGKGSCVFETPCRQAVYSPSSIGAREANLKILNKNLSAQSIGFSRKIREVDEFLLKYPQYIGRLRESHPEYAFSMLNDGKPILSRKVETKGLEERLSVLQRHFSQARPALDKLRRGYHEAILNDILDAMVLAVIGLMGIERGFETIPAEPHWDRRGLRMEIVYCRRE